MSNTRDPEALKAALAEVELAIKQKELQLRTRDLHTRRWTLTTIVPLATIVISVGSSLLIARSAAKARDAQFTAEVISAVVDADQLKGFRKLELLLAANLVEDADGRISNAVSIMRPRVAEELAARGREAMATDSLPKATDLFRAALEIQDTAEYHFLLGHNLLGLGNIRNHNPYREEGRRELEKAFAADTSNVIYALWLGRAHMTLRNENRARALFSSIASNPENEGLQAYTYARQHIAEIDRRRGGGTGAPPL